MRVDEIEQTHGCMDFKQRQEAHDKDIDTKSITAAFQFGIALGFGKRYDEMDKIIEEFKKVITPEPKWIPVSDSLPKKDDLYLICFDNGEYELSYFYKDSFSYSGVIAWMPLPTPYKSQEKEEKE